jgi:hypothetical protein
VVGALGDGRVLVGGVVGERDGGAGAGESRDVAVVVVGGGADLGVGG